MTSSAVSAMIRTMRIAQVLEATLGGTARHVVDLCRGLHAAGHEVHLIHNPREGRVDAIFRAGLAELRTAGIVDCPIDMPRAVLPSDLGVVLAVRRYLREHGPFDVIHGHSSKGGAYARLAGAGVPGLRVYTPNALVTTNPELSRPMRFAYGLMERVLARLTHALIAVSEEELAEALRLGMPRRRVSMVTNGTDVPAAPAFSRSELGLPESGVVIGTVGRLVPQKATVDLVRAFALVAAKHPEARLAIVGSGPLESSVKGEASSLGIASRVHWLGAMDGPAAMAAFDVFALSSLYEGFPYVLIEAMSRGLPIVTTAIGGAAALVEEGLNGFIVPVGRADLLADAIVRVASDDRVRRAMGERSQLRAPLFSAARMVDATLKVYDTAATVA